MNARELDLFEQVATMARNLSEHFTKPDDDWDPFLFMEGADGEEAGILPLGPMMNSVESKDLLANSAIPAVISMAEARVVVMVISVWAVDWEKAGVEPDLSVRPSQHPNRMEKVMVSEFTAEGPGRQAFAPIIRHENAPPTLGEWEDTEVDGVSGRFAGPIVSALKEVSRKSV